MHQEEGTESCRELSIIESVELHADQRVIRGKLELENGYGLNPSVYSLGVCRDSLISIAHRTRRCMVKSGETVKKVHYQKQSIC